jgi:hypothetical protein
MAPRAGRSSNYFLRIIYIQFIIDHRIAKSDINLHVDPGHTQGSPALNPDSLVNCTFSNSFRLDRIPFNNQPIRFGVHARDILDLGDNFDLIVARPSQQINIHGRTQFW